MCAVYEIRDGQRVVPTCDMCGCRLSISETQMQHFYGDNQRDARGCLCPNYGQSVPIGPNTNDYDG